MPADLTISVESDEPAVEPFVDSIAATLEILHDLDARISGKRRSTLWLLGSLTFGSPAAITMHAAPPPTGRDVSMEIVSRYCEGLNILARGEGLPELFSESSLRAAQRLGKLATGQRTVLVSSGLKRVDITPRISANVDGLLDRSYESGGSVEGAMEMATLHGARYFRVYDATHGYGVICYFGEEMLEDVRMAFGKRVSVAGQLRSDGLGKPQTMQVDEIRVLASDTELPTAADLRGVARGMTNGRLAEDYLRDLRGDDT